MTEPSTRIDRIERAIEALVEENRRFAERFAEENLRLSREVGKVSNALGYFAEAIVAPSVPRELRKVGVRVSGRRQRVSQRIDGESFEIDILAVGRRSRGGGLVVAAIEVAQHLNDPEVATCLGKLAEFYRFFPEYRPYDLVGGIAGMRVDEPAAARAEREGLIVLGPSDHMARLLNSPGFRPKVWRAAETP